MSSSAPPSLSLFLILAMLILLVGCMNNGSPGGVTVFSEKNQGIRVIPESVAEYANKSDRMSLDQALVRLEEEIRTEQGLDQYSLHYIRAEEIDRNGDAVQWILGVKTRQQNYFIELRPMGNSHIPWRAWLPAAEINPAAITGPGALIRNNLGVLECTYGKGFTSLDELELSNGIYTIQSVSGNRSVVTRLEAASGKVLE